MQDGVGGTRIAKVKVVQRVAGLGLDPRLVVGRRASPLGLAEGYRLQSSGAVEVRTESAPSRRAAAKGSGNFFPRRSALLRIPAHAVGLKKNLCGSTPVSKTRDNEDSTATLRDSEVLSVQDPHGEPIAELHQRPEEGTKIPSTV
jgi:hypothetical protein